MVTCKHVSEDKNLATSKYVTSIGMIIVAVVAFVIGLVAAPIVMPPSTGTTDSVWENIVKTGVIRVGTDPTWPPFESLNSTNQIVGFEVDLMDAIAKKLNKTVEWSSVLFDNIITSVKSKQLDLGVSGFSVTTDRLEEVQFTMPHSVTRGQVIMLQSKRDSLNITMLTSLTDLKTLSLKAGTQSGTTERDELDVAGVQYSAFSDYGMAIMDMASANPSVDCVYAETPITSSWIAQYQAQGKSIVIVYDTPYYPCAFVANKDAHTLVQMVDGALSDVIASGQLDTLRAKWHA
jgi:ABC-type amino acid transport substrate-binding protein